MAKVSGGEHAGCMVTGRVLNAIGGMAIKTLTIRPERGGMYGGIWYGPNEATVAIEPDGRWAIVLPPSSAVGCYRVMIGRQEFIISVPDAPEAAFIDIAKEVR